MVSRLLCITLTTLLAAAAVADDSGRSVDGVVTHRSGQCLLHRDGKLANLVLGSALKAGDRVETTGDGQVVFVLGSGSVVTLDGYSMVSIEQHDDGRLVDLVTGEIRVAHDGKSPLAIRCAGVQINAARSVVRLQNGEHSHAELIAGQADLLGSESFDQSMELDLVYALTQDESAVSTVRPWGIDPEKIRLASAIQVAPPLQLPNVSGDKAPAIVTKDAPNTISPSDGAPLSDPQNAKPLDPIAQENLDLDDEDELRLAQQPPPATRGDTVDDDYDEIKASNVNTFSGSSSLSLGSLSGSTFGFSAGGLFADAGQQTFQGQDLTTPGNPPFPGSIHLVTANSKYAFNSVRLSASEVTKLFGTPSSGFFSIVNGPAPTTQVVTNYLTGSNVTPSVLTVPGFSDLHVLRLDQYGIPDAGDPTSGGLGSNVGLTGLVGPNPTGPTIVGATPLADDRAEFNKNGGVTFALGEFLVLQEGANGISFSVRTSDQDRLIVKDIGGNDALDQVTPGENVNFTDTTDPRFLPQSPTVKVPDVNNPNGSYNPSGTRFSQLDLPRRAAFTTLVAEQLRDYARRTNQTRFVVDGKIVDISGYRGQ